MASHHQRPSFGDKVNGIVRYIEDPCDAPFLLYVELAKKPALKAVLTFFTFGMSDIARGYFRPKGLRSRRHGRGGKKSGVGRSRIGRALGRVPGLGDDVGNFVGKNLPGGETLSQRHVTQGVKNLWIVDGLLQRALFYWLIVGITTDFLYEWSSLLQQSEFCKRTHEKGVFATGKTGGCLAIQGWIAQAGMIEQRANGGATFTGTIGFLPAGKWTVIFTNEMAQFGNPGQSTHESRVIDAVTQRVLGQSDGESVDQNGVSSTIANAEVEGPIFVQVQSRISWAGAAGVSGNFWATSGDPT